MDFKNPSDLSNNDLKIYMLSLENEFEALKSKLKAAIDEIESVGREYDKCKNELSIRKKII